MADDIVQQHFREVVVAVIGAAVASGVAAAKWFVGREVKRHDSMALDHETRLRTLEQDRVTKNDIEAVYSRIERLAERAEDRHLELLDRIG